MSNLQPSRDGALVDLVDRILVKGVILHADIVISVSGVPLIGVNLKAAIAGLTTMIDYGMMGIWDEQIRKSVLAESREEAPLVENEEIILKTFGSYSNRSKVAFGVRRSGYLYVTNKRLFLFNKNPRKILFETSIERIQGLSVEMNENLKEENRSLRVLIKKNNSDAEVALFHTMDLDALRSALKEAVGEIKKVEVLIPVK